MQKPSTERSDPWQPLAGRVQNGALARLTVQLVLVLTAVAGHAAFQAGAAFRVVTPDPLLPVSGGVGPSKPTERKAGELTVRAMVWEQGTNRVAVVGADFLGFPAALADKARARVRGIAPENILIGVTHTHSAPDCYGFPDAQGRPAADLQYLERVCARMAEAIQEAFDRRQPARIRVATGAAKGKIAYNYYAEQLYDPRCHVIQALSEDGRPIATLVNYAIHPEVIGSERGILSPDLVGPLHDRIAARGGGMGLFMNSAQGGMVTADCRRPEGGENSTWEECIRIGELLADEALRIVADAPVQSDPALQCFSREVRLPVESPMMRQLMQVSPWLRSGQDADAVTTRLNLVNLGDAQILTIPGEALPNIGYYLKRKMRGRHNLLFGLTNDAFGYILTKVDWGSFKRYDYITRTCLGELTGEILIEQWLGLVDASPAPR